MKSDVKFYLPLRLAGYDPNDFQNGCGEGLCISIWLQGCPHKCKGCHNPETWNPMGGKDFVIDEFYDTLTKDLSDKTIHKNLAILGGEPLASYNYLHTIDIIMNVKKEFPDTKIFLWTGYTMKELKQMFPKIVYKTIVNNVDILITDRFDINKYNSSLKLRGSSNQRIWKPRTIFKHRYLKNCTKDY